MRFHSRRAFVSGLSSIAIGQVAARPAFAMQAAIGAAPPQPQPHAPIERTAYSADLARHYGPVTSEPFPVQAVDLGQIDPAFLIQVVAYSGAEQPGTIVINPQTRFLHLVRDGGSAIRYGVGVGREGFGWSGTARIKSKQEWPDWYPPAEMIARQPELREKMSALQSGLGMAGGPGNPLGARAMYLWQGNKDTLFRIHGTVEPWTIGKRVSSGCIRMINQDAIDLYDRVAPDTQVVVLGGRGDEVASRQRRNPDPQGQVYDPARQAPDPYRNGGAYDPYQPDITDDSWRPRSADPYRQRRITDPYVLHGEGYDPYVARPRYDPYGRNYRVLPDD
ncbi:MAG: L,D-transpeptidase [Hyphomicrobiales bacterium]